MTAHTAIGAAADQFRRIILALESRDQRARGFEVPTNMPDDADLLSIARDALVFLLARGSTQPEPPTSPIAIRLTCPACGELHIDEGQFATKPHHTHACQACGNVWRPAIVPTVGVRFLPGFKNEQPPTWAYCEEPPSGDRVPACGWNGEIEMLVPRYGNGVAVCPNCGSSAIREGAP